MNVWNDSIFIARAEPLKKKSFKGKLVDGEVSTDWDKKIHNIYNTLIQHTCHLSMSYSHFPLGVKCLKTSVSIYWTPLISQMITVCHWLHHNSAWTLIVKSTKYLLYVYSVAQLCPILCDSMDCSLPGFSVWNFSNKNTGVGCHFLLQGILPNQG